MTAKFKNSGSILSLARPLTYFFADYDLHDEGKTDVKFGNERLATLPPSLFEVSLVDTRKRLQNSMLIVEFQCNSISPK